MAHDPLLDHIFIYIGDQAFTLAQLGGAVDKPLTEGLQDIVDDGHVGDYPDTHWTDVFSGFKLTCGPMEGEETLRVIYEKWKAEERRCMESSLAGTLTPSDVSAMVALKKNYDMAVRLTRA